MAREKIKPSGKDLKKMMIDADLTAVELAEELNVTPDYIRQICREKRDARRLRIKIESHLKSKIGRVA